MARITKPLTDTEIKNIKYIDKRIKLSDGGGLCLIVTQTSKRWQFDYAFKSKRNSLSLGVYPAVSLRDARDKRDEYKKLLTAGKNPSVIKAKKINPKVNDTFEAIAKERLTKLKHTISDVHYKRVINSFTNDCFPIIGTMSINDITAKHILAVLHKIADRGAMESGRKLFYAINQTFKWAVANYKADRNPAADILLEQILGKNTRQHYPTITDDEGIKNLLLSIDEYKGAYSTKVALKLLAYTFVRPYNIRHAEWNEIDFETCKWNIPASKMKTKEDLIVPLTSTTIVMLEDIKNYTGNEKYIFTGKNRNEPMSDNTLLGAIRRLGYTKEEFTPHGFRAMFSTIAHEKSNFKHEVIETQLAHSIGNSVSQAYNRAKYLDDRVELMQWWSDYIDNLLLCSY